MSIEKAIEALNSRVNYKDDNFTVTANRFETNVYCRGELIAYHKDYYTGVSAFISEDPVIREAAGKAWELIWGKCPIGF